MLSNENEKLDPRVKRTRQGIEQAFVELVKEKGFQAVNVQDITDRAGINRATFYAHFPDKYVLLDRYIQENFRQEVDKRMFHACQFSIDNLRELIVLVCEFVGNTHDHCPAVEQQFHSMVEAQVRAQVMGLLNRWLKDAEWIENTGIAPERAATAAGWAIYGLATEWSRAKQAPPAQQYALEVLPLVAANLGYSRQLA
jgi:AcrR family transcriptional regulator